MPIGTEVGLFPDDIVLDGDQPLPNFWSMSIVAFSALTLPLGDRKGIQPVKKMGDGGGEHWLVRMK